MRQEGLDQGSLNDFLLRFDPCPSSHSLIAFVCVCFGLCLTMVVLLIALLLLRCHCSNGIWEIVFSDDHWGCSLMIEIASALTLLISFRFGGGGLAGFFLCHAWFLFRIGSSNHSRLLDETFPRQEALYHQPSLSCLLLVNVARVFRRHEVND